MIGSIMGINANILPVLEQLGIYEEFVAISSPIFTVKMRHGDRTKIADVTTEGSAEM